MTTKGRAIQAIQTLPEDATLDEIVESLQHLEGPAEPSGGSGQPLPEGGVWALLEQAAGTVEMLDDWASEHDH